MTGVVEPGGNHFTRPSAGPSTANTTNIDEVDSKAIRRIWRGTDAPYVGASDHAQMLVNNGKFVLPCLFDGAGPSNEFTSITPATCRTRAQQFANIMKDTCSVVEIVNEVYNTEHRVPPGPGGGKYWPIFRDLSDIFRAAGMQVLLSGVPNRLSFLDDCEAEDIWSYADGVAIHCYFLNPGTNLTTAGTILRQLKLARDKIDAFGGAAVGLPLWMSEFGWVTQKPNPSGSGANLYCTEAQQTAKIQTAYSGFETHAETLKLRAATIFTWQDWSSNKNNSTLLTPFRYSGIRTNEVPPYNPAPWRWKDGGASRDMLNSFGEGTVDTGGTEAAPEVVTLAPPSAVDMDSAILRGTTDPNSLPTTYHYEYSLNPLPATDPLAMPVGFLPRTNSAAAGLVVAHPAEERPQNVENASMPASGDLTAWRAAFTSTALSHYKASVNGQYTGTTDEIIQWAARKWGFHPDILRAVAVKESDWDQGQLGDARVTTALAASCTMPGDTTITVVDRDAIAAEPVEPIVQVGTGADYMRWGGTAAGPERLTGCTTHARFYPGSGTVASGQQVKGVWDSYGLFQMKRPYAWTTPHVHIPRDNSAFCADYYGQILRGYYNGLETWLSAYDPPGVNGQPYAAGDLWGSIGAWYSGRWHDAAAEGYISSVQAILAARTWEGF